MTLNTIVLALFARSPVRGEVKTRLAPWIGEEGALLIHKLLIKKVYLNSLRAFPDTTELWVSSEENEEYFLSICNKRDIFLQRGDDLGERMAHAVREILSRSQGAILVGADCLSVDSAYLQDAANKLREGAKLVLGPAEDGGYVLIGVSTVGAPGLDRLLGLLFDDMPWGTSAVMAQTRERLQAAGICWEELPTRWDVDRPEDLQRVRIALPDEPSLRALLRPDLLAAIASQSDSR